jgi:hypothetical protein
VSCGLQCRCSGRRAVRLDAQPIAKQGIACSVDLNPNEVVGKPPLEIVEPEPERSNRRDAIRAPIDDHRSVPVAPAAETAAHETFRVDDKAGRLR